MAEVKFESGSIDISASEQFPNKLVVSIADGEGGWAAVVVDRSEAIDAADAILRAVQDRDQVEVANAPSGDLATLPWFAPSLARRGSAG